MKNKDLLPSELRYDPVSQDWVVIATGRARRPDSFAKDRKSVVLADSVEECPFEDMDTQKTPTLMISRGARREIVAGAPLPQDWTTVSFPNKYPAFAPEGSFVTRIQGPYEATDGIGFHEVVATRDHARDVADFTLPEAEELLAAYQTRFLELKKVEFVNYISIFKNKGAGAGASIAHPHSQIVAIPMLDPEIEGSIRGSQSYYAKKGTCVHCDMLEYDRKEKIRVVYENEKFVAVCPFASIVAFETRIYPIHHASRFEETSKEDIGFFADALVLALGKIKKALGDPDYNYFIHTSPTDSGEYGHYHWHVEILPKSAHWAGFELSTGIPISTLEPEKAAEFLRTI
ncbi:MAG: DUF4921 family protein [Candidatus Wildermuthbacteria bacterium]|nr:DUF4921 family protein [Candidatus Wildermuthbacteria bacterium]